MVMTFGKLRDEINSISIPDSAPVLASFGGCYNYLIRTIFSEKIDESDLDWSHIDESMIGKDALYIDLK